MNLAFSSSLHFLRHFPTPSEGFTSFLESYSRMTLPTRSRLPLFSPASISTSPFPSFPPTLCSSPSHDSISAHAPPTYHPSSPSPASWPLLLPLLQPADPNEAFPHPLPISSPPSLPSPPPRTPSQSLLPRPTRNRSSMAQLPPLSSPKPLCLRRRKPQLLQRRQQLSRRPRTQTSPGRRRRIASL